ncbi:MULTISPECIES: helix-turn-helix transcriptional regulator, partial [unclassified Methylobacterium]|uniref:helix-turn-helix transcriptional regulator n=1 Tax=unclassified Methylobacterium TaxID=2615210 RepID=UPI00226A8B53
QQVQKYEKGVNRIGCSRLQAIADTLQVPVDAFFDGRLGSDGGKTVASTFYDDPKLTKLVLAFKSISDEGMRDNALSIVKAIAALRPSQGPQT